MEPQFLRGRDLDLLEGHLRRSTETKNAILRANLRLVVSIARKHLRPGLSLMELISDGNITLMRAVEGFDIHRGHRFSTYATLALMKGFARSVPQMLSERRATGYADDDQMLAQLPDRRVVSHADRFADREEVSQLLSHLTDRERMVLLAQYGLEGHDGQSDPAGLARQLGLSRQQLRQLEKSAMAKLRSATGVSVDLP
jgi:RNA polymerase primary sigma factor